MADPSRDVYVMVGDGSYLMLAQEIITSIQEDYKLIIVLVNNEGHSSIGGLSRATGVQGFATRFATGMRRAANSRRLFAGGPRSECRQPRC